MAKDNREDGFYLTPISKNFDLNGFNYLAEAVKDGKVIYSDRAMTAKGAMAVYESQYLNVERELFRRCKEKGTLRVGD